MTASRIPVLTLLPDCPAALRWSEAANRRLRAMMWKGHSVAEIAFLLGRPVAMVQVQLRTLGLKG